MNTNTIPNRLLLAGRALLLGMLFFFGQAQATDVTYDGIYLWSSNNFFLSLHQDGTKMIGTIYFNDDASHSFPATTGGGVLPVPQLDLFDLMHGDVTGSTAQMDGTRFHRACNVGYDFTFNNDATITVTRIGVSNTPAADLAHISCSSIVGMEPATMIVPKIRFNPDPVPSSAPIVTKPLFYCYQPYSSLSTEYLAISFDLMNNQTYPIGRIEMDLEAIVPTAAIPSIVKYTASYDIVGGLASGGTKSLAMQPNMFSDFTVKAQPFCHDASRLLSVKITAAVDGNGVRHTFN